MKTRPNALLATAFAVVLALAVIAAVVSSSQREPALDLDTPEGTAQAYALAVLQNKESQAFQFLDPQHHCQGAVEGIYVDESESVQIRLESAETVGESAEVTLLIDHYGGLYDTWSQNETITLKKMDGSWYVMEASWPFYGCE